MNLLDIPKQLYTLNKGRQRSRSSPAGCLPSQQRSSDRRLLFPRLSTSPIPQFDVMKNRQKSVSIVVKYGWIQYCEWFAYLLWLMELFMTSSTLCGLSWGHIPQFWSCGSFTQGRVDWRHDDAHRDAHSRLKAFKIKSFQTQPALRV